MVDWAHSKTLPSLPKTYKCCTKYYLKYLNIKIV